MGIRGEANDALIGRTRFFAAQVDLFPATGTDEDRLDAVPGNLVEYAAERAGEGNISLRPLNFNARFGFYG